MSIALYTAKGDPSMPRAFSEWLDGTDEPLVEVVGTGGEEVTEQVYSIPVSLIERNAHQPRSDFDADSLRALSESIAQYGVLSPLSVRRVGERRYELIAGERRLRAATLAGLQRVPCLIVPADDRTSAEMAIVENLQRRDLTMFEEATAIRSLLSTYRMTQEEVAARLSVSQSYVANKLRLLRLPASVARRIVDEGLSERHARALLRLRDEETQKLALTRILEEKMNVAATEEYVERLVLQAEEPPRHRPVPTGEGQEWRMFYHTLDHALDALGKTGIRVEQSRSETESAVEIILRLERSV